MINFGVLSPQTPKIQPSFFFPTYYKVIRYPYIYFFPYLLTIGNWIEDRSKAPPLHGGIADYGLVRILSYLTMKRFLCGNV